MATLLWADYIRPDCTRTDYIRPDYTMSGIYYAGIYYARIYYERVEQAQRHIHHPAAAREALRRVLHCDVREEYLRGALPANSVSVLPPRPVCAGSG